MRPPRARIRRFRPDDLARVVEIERQSFGEHAWPAADFRDLASEPLFLVATLNNSVSAYSITLIARGTAELISIGVARRWRARGLASSLLARSLKLASAAGAAKAALMVRTTNTAAIRLYRKFCFTKVRSVPGYYEDGTPALRMTRTLPGLLALCFLFSLTSAAQPPAIFPNGVVNAASRMPPALDGGSIARGSRVLIRGIRLEDARVLFGREPARVVANSGARIEAVVPETAPPGSVEVTISGPRGTSEPLSLARHRTRRRQETGSHRRQPHPRRSTPRCRFGKRTRRR